jgi:hypothetical protein
MTTYTTIGDLEGLSDGTAVAVKNFADGVATAFTKQAEGLAREGAVVPFRMFTGALEKGLVTDGQDEIPHAGQWYWRTNWMYFVHKVDETTVTYTLFRDGIIYPPYVRTRMLSEFNRRDRRKQPVDDPESAVGRLQNVEVLSTELVRVTAELAEANATRDADRRKARQFDEQVTRLRRYLDAAQNVVAEM